MRAIWTGAIGFGLVNIPVKLFSATQDSALDLDMLDKHGHAQIRYARINSETGKEVAWEDIVKGYKLGDRYVVLSDADFAKVSPEKNKMVNIKQFVPVDSIDSTYYDTPYYLAPSKGGEKAYILLREALKKSGKVAVGQFVLRNKDALCVLKAQDDALLLLRIRFPEEIRDTEGLDIPGNIKVTAEELKMAMALIAQLTPKKPGLEQYKDTYDEELLKLINAKAKGKKVAEPKFKIVHNRSKDLMAQLKASLGGSATTRKKAS